MPEGGKSITSELPDIPWYGAWQGVLSKEQPEAVH
jgi:hypothetical protein